METFVAQFSTLVQQSEAYRSFARKICCSILDSCAVVCGLWIVCNFLSEMLMIEAAPVFTNQRFLRRQKSLVKLCGAVIVCKDLLLDSRYLSSRLRLAHRLFTRKICCSIFDSCVAVCGSSIVCKFRPEMLMIGGGSSLYSPEIPPLSLQSIAAWSSFGNVCCSILDSCAAVCGLSIVCDFRSEDMLVIAGTSVFTRQRFLRRQKSLVKSFAA